MSSKSKHIVYFVRHGQCKGNVSGETLPPEDDLITDFGRQQASALGERLKDIKFTKAYASTYQRAIETAKEVLAKNVTSSSIPLEQDERIKERELGEMVGKPAKEIAILTIQKLKDGLKFNEIEIPGAETQAQYVRRMKEFLKDLLEFLKTAKEPQTVLIVSHGLYMRRLLVCFNDSSFDDICNASNWSQKCASVIYNTSCTTFFIEFPSGDTKPTITFDVVHDCEHLKSLTGNNPKSAHNITPEQRNRLIEEIMKIPGGKEEMSGCIPF